MVQTLWDSITQSITGAPSDDDIRRRREDESAFASLYDAARQRDAELAAAGRRPVLGGLLSKEPVAGMDTLRYEGITPLILGLLSPVARAVDAPMAAYQGNIPMQDMAGEALGTAGMAALGGAALTRPAGSVGMGGRVGGDDAARQFMVDESGAIRLTRENAPLIAHHNLSPRGVQVSSEIGGIPMPSMAISRADYPLTNFGDITLLADPSMVQPSRSVGVWPTDVYTGRQPRGELQFANQKAATSAMKADPTFGHMRDITYWMDATNSFSDADEMLKTAQLGAREGIDPKSYDNMWDYVRDVRSKLGYSLYDERDKMPGFESYGGLERVLYPKEMFTASGNRRKPAPYTLESVMKRMAQDKAYTAGSEGWDYGPGSFRAVAAPSFRNMNEVQSARGQILPQEQMQPVKDAFSEAFDAVLRDVNAAYTGSGWAEGQEAMRELAMGRNPTWFGDIPADVRANVRELAATSRNMPTEYFEAKPRTSYALGDFSAALVPENDAASVDVLRQSGVQNVLTYGTPEERVALFKRFPELLFSLGAPVGLLSLPQDEEMQ
jgi:hypothetical protein